MTEQLPDTIRHLYTDPAEFIDSDHPIVQDFAKTAAPANAGEREKAGLLYKAVRDGIRYNPYVNMRVAETFRASSVLAAGQGYCVGKASLYGSSHRGRDIAFWNHERHYSNGTQNVPLGQSGSVLNDSSDTGPPVRNRRIPGGCWIYVRVRVSAQSVTFNCVWWSRFLFSYSGWSVGEKHL